MIELQGVSKSYHTRSGVKRVLDDVSFELKRGESLGVMGRNGAGKSTLTRVLSGLEQPDRGFVRRSMSVSWPIGYSSAFQPSLTGADNVRFIARIYGRDIEETLRFVQDYAELGEYFRMPVFTYSAGMRARLAFGSSLAIDFECYLIDEITGAGDHRFAARTQAAMRARRESGSLLMISHDPETLRAYCSKGAVLNNGRLQFYDDVDEMIEAYYAL